MTENGLVQTFIADAKARLRGAVILKHADRFTAHIPDVEILMLDKTSWFEAKYPRGKRKLKDIVETGQVLMAHELEVVCGGRSWFLVWDGDAKETQVWRPQAMAAHLYPNLVIGYKFAPILIEDPEEYDLFTTLRTHGMIRMPGINNVLPLNLLRDAIRSSR